MASHKGKYKVKNPKKYVGDPTKVVYRSSWELQALNALDRSENVLKFASEECIIPYVSPLDGKVHRYFVDLYAKVKRPDGSIKEFLIEIKPYKQTIPPKPQQRKTRKYLKEVKTYAVNEAKWKAAQQFCKKRGWEFLIWHEKNIRFING